MSLGTHEQDHALPDRSPSPIHLLRHQETVTVNILRRDFAGITLALANTDAPDTSHYSDPEIVYRVNKSKHVGLIFCSDDQKRVYELMGQYTKRITNDFLAVAPVKERYDD